MAGEGVDEQGGGAQSVENEDADEQQGGGPHSVKNEDVEGRARWNKPQTSRTHWSEVSQRRCGVSFP